MKKGNWTEIFRSGNYGTKGIYTNSDLDQMVANFNQEDQVPIVVGHPETDSPAWGWLSEVKRDGDVLLARPDDLHADFEKALDEKKFKNRSVRIVAGDTGHKILHLGYLGAMLPQVEGLKTAQFASDGKCANYDFDLSSGDAVSEVLVSPSNKETDMDKDKEIADLKKKLADEKKARDDEKKQFALEESKSRKSAFARFVESKMIATGKLAKERKDEAVAFLMTLPVGEKADFAWGDADDEKGSSIGWFQDFVAGMAQPDFVNDLPVGEKKDFSSNEKGGVLVDLSHQV